MLLKRRRKLNKLMKGLSLSMTKVQSLSSLLVSLILIRNLNSLLANSNYNYQMEATDLKYLMECLHLKVAINLILNSHLLTVEQ